MLEIHDPHLNRTVKLGRKRPIAVGPRLFFKNYRIHRIPLHADACDFRKPALPSLYRLFLNDKIGDCVVAAGYHVVGVVTGNAGNLFIPSYDQIIKDYSAIGGYVPGDTTTDQGCDEVTALNYWCDHGFANGTKGLGWLEVDPSNKEEIHAAQYLFENLFIAIELPWEWIEPFPRPGFKWDAVGPAIPGNGHAIMGLGYNPAGVIVNSWGMMGTLTWAAIKKYCSARNGGSLYTMVTPDQLTKGATKAPNGMRWEIILDDFKMMGGVVPPYYKV